MSWIEPVFWQYRPLYATRCNVTRSPCFKQQMHRKYGTWWWSEDIRTMMCQPHHWWKHVVEATRLEFPRLVRMVRQHLTVPTTSASPDRLFSSVGLVKSDLEWHTHTYTRTYTHLPLCHWHTLVIVTDTHQHIDRGLYTYMTSYLTQSYRLSTLIDNPTLFINSWLIRLWVDNVLLINTRRLSILIDKSIPLSIGIPNVDMCGEDNTC